VLLKLAVIPPAFNEKAYNVEDNANTYHRPAVPTQVRDEQSKPKKRRDFCHDAVTCLILLSTSKYHADN